MSGTITLEAAAKAPEAPERTTPGAMAWRRFKRDKVGVASGIVVLLYFVVGLGAPVISRLYGKNPYETYGQNIDGLLNEFGFPVGANGGISSEHWFGLEPKLGRDVLTQLLYGIRTSLLIALAVVLIVTVIGTLIGIAAGYFGGVADFLINRTVDVFNAVPSTLFFIAMAPVLLAVFVLPDEETPSWMRAMALILALSLFGWMKTARILRAQTLSLRERDFVRAAKVAGMSPWRIITRELLPNLWTPILILVALEVPTMVTTEAAMSYLGVGMIEPTPDWGRMIKTGSQVYQYDFTYMAIPGVALLIFILAFNLFGDAVRDALDPKNSR